MIALLLATVATSNPEPDFLKPIHGKDLAAAEAALGGPLVPLGKSKSGYDVYVFYRTPDHSMGSPYVYVGLSQGKIGPVGWSKAATPADPPWLGPAYIRKIPMQITAGVLDTFPPPSMAKPASAAPKLQLQPQEIPDIPDQPLNDDGVDLPGNLVM